MTQMGSSLVYVVAGALAVVTAVPAVAQRAWTPPVVLGASGQQALPRVAVDGAGNALTTWLQATGTSRTTDTARLTSASGLWTPAAPLSLAGGTTLFEDSDVAVNAAGAGVAAWTRVNPGPGSTNEVVQAALYTATTGTWTAPLDLFSPTSNGVAPPKVAIDDAGNALVTWVQTLGGAQVVRASRFDAALAQWSATPALLSPGPGTAIGNSELSMDGDGNAMVIWTWVNSAPTVVQAARYVRATGTWSAPATLVGPVPGQPRLSLARTGGSAFAVWRSSDASGKIVAARFNAGAGSWSAAVDVSAVGLNAAEPDVATDATGNAMAVWTINAGGGTRRLQSARYASTTGAWGAPTDRMVSGEPSQPAVAVDAAGNAVAVWRMSELTSSDRIQGAIFSAVAAAWGTNQELSGPNNPSGVPDVRLDGAGGAVAIWNGTDAGGGPAVQASVYALAGAPRLLPAVVNRPNVTLTWQPPLSGPAPVSYTVVGALTPGGPVVAAQNVGVQTSVTAAVPDGTYYVHVVATMAVGAPVASNETQVVVGVGPAPTAPQNFQATVAGGIVTMTWAPPANAAVAPVQTYILEAGTAPGASNLAIYPTGNIGTTVVSPPAPAGSYWLRVRAQGAGGVSPASAEVRAVVGPPPPGAPALSGNAAAGGVVTLSWTAAPAPGAPVSGYRLLVGTAPGLTNVAVIDLPPAPLGAAGAGVPAGTYYVRVVALSSQGPGDPSNELTLVVP